MMLSPGVITVTSKPMNENDVEGRKLGLMKNMKSKAWQFVRVVFSMRYVGGFQRLGYNVIGPTMAKV